MVKGVSRQVIVVHSPDKKLFEQAIFILNENAVGNGAVTDEMLLREAQEVVRSPVSGKRRRNGPVWACVGAALTGMVWLLTALF